MNSVLISAALLVTATQTLAQTDVHPISNAIATRGLAAVEADLTALASPKSDERFLLGGVRFLRGVERAFQTRHRHGITTEHSMLPLLRMAVPPNPNPEPFEPAMIAGIFEDALTDMAAAEAALVTLDHAADVAVVLSLDDLWFDLNENGIREPVFEDLSGYFPPNAESAATVRFDHADVAWLRAYTHVISGMAELTLAFDPTDAIAAVLESSETLDALTLPSDRSNWILQERSILDYLATVKLALDQQPDPTRVAAAHDHFLQMVALNRVFWERVAAESDDRLEWIPSNAQTSALGLTFPPGVGDVWIGVLTEMEAVLAGELLIPHPFLGSGGGINLKAWVDNPSPIDLLGWAHGYGGLDYIQPGPVFAGDGWDRFTQLVGRGNGMFFAVVLN